MDDWSLESTQASLDSKVLVEVNLWQKAIPIIPLLGGVIIYETDKDFEVDDEWVRQREQL